MSLIFAAGLCLVNLGGVHRVSVCPVHARARLSDLTDPIAWLALRTFLIIGIAIVRFKKTE